MYPALKYMFASILEKDVKKTYLKNMLNEDYVRGSQTEHRSKSSENFGLVQNNKFASTGRFELYRVLPSISLGFLKMPLHLYLLHLLLQFVNLFPLAIPFLLYLSLYSPDIIL